MHMAGQHAPDILPARSAAQAGPLPHARTAKEQVLDFVSEFVAETAKGNLVLFSAILGGFGIFFTERIFWVAFYVVVADACLSLYSPNKRLPSTTEEEYRELRWLGVVLRSCKGLLFSFLLLLYILIDDISVSANCMDVCRARGKLALVLGLASLFGLETLPLLCSTTLPLIISHIWKMEQAYRTMRRRNFFSLYLLVSSVASVAITAHILLIMGGSYAIFTGWESFVYCWAVLAVELIVEGAQRAERAPQYLLRWRALGGALIRMPFHTAAFILFLIYYKHLRFAAPALNIELCDSVCQRRLQNILLSLTYALLIQALLSLGVIAFELLRLCGCTPVRGATEGTQHDMSTGADEATNHSAKSFANPAASRSSSSNERDHLEVVVHPANGKALHTQCTGVQLQSWGCRSSLAAHNLQPADKADHKDDTTESEFELVASPKEQGQVMPLDNACKGRVPVESHSRVEASSVPSPLFVAPQAASERASLLSNRRATFAFGSRSSKF